MPHALFIVAHQDDEVAMATRMKYLLRFGWAISVVYLTDGIRPDIRDDESRRALSCIGVDLARVHFIGSEEHIPDGALVDHLDRALRLVEERIRDKVDAVYCLAWEGGHHDHDASHLVAIAFASHRGVLDQTFEMPLYHGHRTPGPVFRSFAPLGGGWTSRKITMRDGLQVASLCKFHKSQRRTWLMLMPEALIRLIVMGRESTRRVDVARLGVKPHAGKLYYERRFGVTWTEFEAKSRSFVTSILP